MVRKIIQWVPIEGTRWRSEVADGQENRAVDSYYGVAPGGDMAPLRELPNTAAFFGLCGRGRGALPKDDPNVVNGLVGKPEYGDVTKLQMNINSETQVIEEAEFKTFGSGSAIASSSLTTEWVKGKTSRKRWPSRTRISSKSSAFSCATLLHATRYSRTGERLQLVGSPIF